MSFSDGKVHIHQRGLNRNCEVHQQHAETGEITTSHKLHLRKKPPDFPQSTTYSLFSQTSHKRRNCPSAALLKGDLGATPKVGDWVRKERKEPEAAGGQVAAG